MEMIGVDESESKSNNPTSTIESLSTCAGNGEDDISIAEKVSIESENELIVIESSDISNSEEIGNIHEEDMDDMLLGIESDKGFKFSSSGSRKKVRRILSDKTKEKKVEKLNEKIKEGEMELSNIQKSRQLQQQEQDAIGKNEEDNDRTKGIVLRRMLFADAIMSSSSALQMLTRLSPILSKVLKPHQMKGVRFLYDHIAVKKLGCVLADYMGLGKTIQVLSLIHSYLCPNPTGLVCDLEIERKRPRKHILDNDFEDSGDDFDDFESEKEDPNIVIENKTVLILAPASVVQNWIGEVSKWFGNGVSLYTFFNSSSDGANQSNEVSDKEFAASRKMLNIQALDPSLTLEGKLSLVKSWSKKGGILVAGYELYRALVPPQSGNKKKTAIKIHHNASFYPYLCDPGPSLVILDEGHRLKHEKSMLVQCVKQIKTPLRVVLTGYPLQNHLIEYYCMIDFARPGFLGTSKAFKNKFVIPITRGRMEESTREEKKLASMRAYVLTESLKQFVLRRDNSTLKNDLPPKYEWVIHCKLTKLQMKLYKSFLVYRDATASEFEDKAGLVTAYHHSLAIVNHPDIIYKKYQASKSTAPTMAAAKNPSFFVSKMNHETISLDDDSSEEDDNTEKNVIQRSLSCVSSSSSLRLRNDQPSPVHQNVVTVDNDIEIMDEVEASELLAKPHTYIWADSVLKGYPQPISGNISLSGKMVTLFSLLEGAKQVGDKTIVFSQSLATLDIIQQELKKKSIKHMRMDGSTSQVDRQKIVNDFNKQSNCIVIIASTRACGEGINLHSANRIVMMDTCWNPCIDHEAMCRAYRYGQKKPVYVYRLVAAATMEQKIYDLQTSKHSLTKTIVDDHSVKGIATSKGFFLSLSEFAKVVDENEERYQQEQDNEDNNEIKEVQESSTPSRYDDEEKQDALAKDMVLSSLVKGNPKSMIKDVLLADLLISDVTDEETAPNNEKMAALEQYRKEQSIIIEKMQAGMSLDEAQFYADQAAAQDQAKRIQQMLQQQQQHHLAQREMQIPRMPQIPQTPAPTIAAAVRSYLNLSQVARVAFLQRFRQNLCERLRTQEEVQMAYDNFLRECDNTEKVLVQSQPNLSQALSSHHSRE